MLKFQIKIKQSWLSSSQCTPYLVSLVKTNTQGNFDTGVINLVMKRNHQNYQYIVVSRITGGNKILILNSLFNGNGIHMYCIFKSFMIHTILTQNTW